MDVSQFLKLIFLFLLSSITVSSFTQVKHSQPKPLPQPPNYLDTILLSNPEYFDAIVKNPRVHHLQIIYTQINRDSNNKASFKNYTYRLNKNEFFYSASMVKLPTCALAFEKVEEL